VAIKLRSRPKQTITNCYSTNKRYFLSTSPGRVLGSIVIGVETTQATLNIATDNNSIMAKVGLIDV
jgi:hypothetical protein